MQEGGRHGFVAFAELSSFVAALRLLRCESRSPSLRLQRAGRGVDHCGDGRCAPLEPIIRHIASRRTLFAWSSPCFCKESQTNTAAPASLIQFIFYNQSTTSSTLSNNFLQPHNTSTMAARSRLPLIAGLGAATFGGYYMYRAGGSPKVAEKQIERTSFSFMTSAAATNIVQTTPPASHQQQEMSCPAAPRSSRPRQRSTASRLARRLMAL